MPTLFNDLKYAIRTLAKSPAFTLTALVALGLGIGANTAIFTVVNSLLIRPLPYRDPDRIVMVFEKHKLRPGRPKNSISPANLRDWNSRNHVFSEMAGFFNNRSYVTGMGDPLELREQIVTAGFFSVLGVQPQRGRTFTAKEDAPNGPDVAIISHSLWQRLYGAREDTVGQTLTVSARPHTIVGIMPPGFRTTEPDVDIWRPMGLDPAIDYRARSGRYMYSIARLRDGVSLERAQSEMVAIASNLEQEFNKFNANWTVNVLPIKEQFVGDVRTPVIVLLGAVGFVLLIACANVANLLLARSAVRSREIAIRTSLGAGRARLVRQLLTESTLLSVGAGVIGMALSVWGVDLLIAMSPKDLSLRRDIAPDVYVLGFNLILSMATGLIFGLAPAITATRTDLNDALKQHTRTSGSGSQRMRSALVVAEVALGLVLLTGAGLLIRSFARLQSVNPGFNSDRLLTMRILLPGAKYREPQQRIAFFQQALEKVRAIPGVESVGSISFLPLAGLGAATGFTVDGRPAPPPGEGPVTGVSTVDPGYFGAMRIPLLRGRLFSNQDNSASAPRVFVISDALAKTYFPNEDPIGKRIRVQMGDDNPGKIIGIVGDVRGTSLDEPARPNVYYLHQRLAYSGMTFVIRSRTEALDVAPSALAAVRSLDRDLPVGKMEPMSAVLSDSVARSRFTMLLLAVFAGLALVLAVVGVYGVMSYAVNQRTQEIGLRMALGAGRGHVVRLVVSQSMKLVLIGVVAGLGASLLLTRVLSTLLFSVSPTDPLTFTVVALLLAAVTAAASLIPARRAASVDPMVALRYE